MPRISIVFSETLDLGNRFDEYLDYVFCADMQEFARQSHKPVGFAVYKRDGLLMDKSDSVQTLVSVRDEFLSEMSKRSVPAVCMSAFDVSFEFDRDGGEAFEKAVQLMGIVLSDWSIDNDRLVAFGLHLSQKSENGGFEVPHAHVLWDSSRMPADALQAHLVEAFS